MGCRQRPSTTGQPSLYRNRLASTGMGTTRMRDQTTSLFSRRRAVLKGALALAPWLICPARAQDDPASAPPQPGDRLVFLVGPKKGAPIRSDDLTLGGPQVQAYPADPNGVVRDGSRLNLVIVVRIGSDGLSEET